MKNKIKFILIAIMCSIILTTKGMLFAETEIAETDRKAILEVLDELAQAIVKEDLNSILIRLSSNMDRKEYNEIKEILEEKFDSYDYSEYNFSPPASRKMEVLEPNKKVRFKVRYSEKYKGASSSGTSSGLTAKFTMEKINGQWLILNTDFYTKEKVIKILGVTLGISVGFFVLLIILCSILWLWLLIDCIKREFSNPNDKIMWILLFIFTQTIGALIYYLVVKRKRGSK